MVQSGGQRGTRENTRGYVEARTLREASIYAVGPLARGLVIETRNYVITRPPEPSRFGAYMVYSTTLAMSIGYMTELRS